MSTRQPPKYAWVIVLLLFLFMLINFADKAVIGLAAGPIMKELELTPTAAGDTTPATVPAPSAMHMK